ncbi:MAG: sensor histidine kinase [Cyclobacteriaceae bacterium]|nr:sensor histidine kinase [Cyclobacteriaceae bacterium]
MTDNPDTYFVLLFVAGTAVMLLMAVAIVLFVIFHQKKMMKEEVKQQRMELDYQKKMLKAALESQESERKRVAKDLHDDVGMMLMTLRVNLNDQTNNGVLEELRQLVDETHESVRRISWDLMPTTIDNFGLFQSVQEMCDRLSRNGKVQVTYSETGQRQTLDKDQELLLYRIAQESVSNALKHAHALKIEVRFEWIDDSLKLSILDDGVGFDFPTPHAKIDGRHGLGLYNLENRVALLGASLAFEKNDPTGTIVSITTPLSTHEPH